MPVPGRGPAVEKLWSTLLLRRTTVPGSKLGRRPRYSASFQQILPLYLKTGNDCFLPHHFQLIVKAVSPKGLKMSITEECQQVIWYLRSSEILRSIQW